MWHQLALDLEALLDNSDNPITTLANAAAYLYRSIDRINWLGFYIYDGDKLYLGPFGGKPACTKIEMGNGVCGTSASKLEVIVVEDVEKFPGHIVCDPDSRSEIVLPIILGNGKLFGVLDIDSAELSRFGNGEKTALINITEVIAAKLQATN